MKYTVNPPKKNYPTNRIVKNRIGEKRSTDLMDMSDYKSSTSKDSDLSLLSLIFFEAILGVFH